MYMRPDNAAWLNGELKTKSKTAEIAIFLLVMRKPSKYVTQMVKILNKMEFILIDT